MCGIVGYWASKPSDKSVKLFARLCQESMIRGLHSFGLSWEDNGVIQTRKWLSPKESLSELPNLISGANCAIWHNRYSTSGNWREKENNQPILYENMSLAFNGVLDMRTKAEMEHDYGFSFPGDNDGFLFLHALDKGISSESALLEIGGTFAGVWLNGSGEVYAIRNRKRPLWWIGDESLSLFVSTSDIACRAESGFQPKPLPVGREMKLSLCAENHDWLKDSYSRVPRLSLANV